MHVYEVVSCEEYAWQVSHGLWANRDKAIAAARELCRKEVSEHHAHRGQDISVSVIENIDSAYVLLGLWTGETFDEWLAKTDSSYWWYHPPFNHVGAFAVMPREVQD